MHINITSSTSHHVTSHQRHINITSHQHHITSPSHQHQHHITNKSWYHGNITSHEDHININITPSSKSHHHHYHIIINIIIITSASQHHHYICLKRKFLLRSFFRSATDRFFPRGSLWFRFFLRKWSFLGFVRDFYLIYILRVVLLMICSTMAAERGVRLPCFAC